jgi:hypothetical protein
MQVNCHQRMDQVSSEWQQLARLARDADAFRGENRTDEPVQLWGS